MENLSDRFAILGDIHGNLEALEAVLADAKTQGCTRYACVGDLVGYNANPSECLTLIQQLDSPCVKGNHDEYASSDDPLVGLNPRATTSMNWTRRKLDETSKNWLRSLPYTRMVAGFQLVHATLDNPGGWGYIADPIAAAASFTYQTTGVCFYGHTHLALAFVRQSVVWGGAYSRIRLQPGRQYLINAGSVGEPRDGQTSATYVVYDLSNRTIELRRVPYDLSLTEAKLLQYGLPLRRKH